MKRLLIAIWLTLAAPPASADFALSGSYQMRRVCSDGMPPRDPIIKDRLFITFLPANNFEISLDYIDYGTERPCHQLSKGSFTKTGNTIRLTIHKRNYTGYCSRGDSNMDEDAGDIPLEPNSTGYTSVLPDQFGQGGACDPDTKMIMDLRRISEKPLEDPATKSLF